MFVAEELQGENDAESAEQQCGRECVTQVERV